MKIVIGMPQTGHDLFRIYMKSKYVWSLRRSGAKVRWIDLGDTDKAIAQLLECDGLLLPGGGDIDPKYYGQTPTEKCGKPHVLRDTVEMRMLEAFLPTKKPILCICRGEQLLNVFFGGTLHQDISEIQKVSHSHFPSRSRGIHGMNLTKGTRLAEILKAETLTVNSLHHQAADRIGQGLTLSAVSEDGFPEALEVTDHPFCIGVQWHPEHMSFRNPRQQDIFHAFVRACEKA